MDKKSSEMLNAIIKSKIKEQEKKKNVKIKKIK